MCSSRTRMNSEFPLQMFPLIHGDMCVCMHTVELCKIRDGKGQGDGKSPLTKLTPDDHEGNSQCLITQFTNQNLQHRVGRGSGGREVEVTTLLWPEGISCSILACVLCTKGRRHQRETHRTV